MAYLPTPYQPLWNYGQQIYPGVQPQAPQAQGLVWVDGEAAAKAYQMPAGWPANTPIALWDTNDTVIYLKSTNPMGMPNQLQKAHYKLEEWTPRNSGDSAYAEYATKKELKEIRDEIEKLLKKEEEV